MEDTDIAVMADGEGYRLPYLIPPYLPEYVLALGIGDQSEPKIGWLNVIDVINEIEIFMEGNCGHKRPSARKSSTYQHVESSQPEKKRFPINYVTMTRRKICFHKWDSGD